MNLVIPDLCLSQHWIASDLDVWGYSGKWRSAKEYVSRHTDLTGDAYWLAVRLHFLETGGQYKSQK